MHALRLVPGRNTISVFGANGQMWEMGAVEVIAGATATLAVEVGREMVLERYAVLPDDIEALPRRMQT